MRRLLTAVRTDVRVQLRNNLYAIGIGVGTLIAAALAWLVSPSLLPSVVPALLLIVTGGSTLVYVGGMILLEKEQGTLNANIVSPLRPAEYLRSKVITLSALATLESAVMVGGAMLIMGLSAPLRLPNIPLMLAGIISIGVVYTLFGIILVVRFDRITDFLVPMAGVAAILQLPFLYFLGWVKHPILLAVPTSAPTMFIHGAYQGLVSWEWLYAVGYTLALIVVLMIWVQRAFANHVVMKVGK